jgi:hypothetical protein
MTHASVGQRHCEGLRHLAGPTTSLWEERQSEMQQINNSLQRSVEIIDMTLTRWTGGIRKLGSVAVADGLRHLEVDKPRIGGIDASINATTQRC